MLSEEDQRKKIEYLYSIKSVRETNKCTNALIESNQLENFDVHLSKLDDVVKYVIKTITSSYPTKESLLKIPIHGRYQHFEGNGKPRLTNLIKSEFKDLPDIEICKKLIDLFTVSVLLDAGAGNTWKYKESDGTVVSRSEGLAIASLNMFVEGYFSSSKIDKYLVNGDKLASFDREDMRKGFQISNDNMIEGFEGRFELIHRLGQTLCSNEELFGKDGRPGNMIDYLVKSKLIGKTADGNSILDLQDIWIVLIKGLEPIWPKEGRLKIYGEVIGDAWYLKDRIKYSQKALGVKEIPEWSKIVTFHKLVQWLTYSLFLPLMKYGHFKILNQNYMTGLPEYRNGGLFVDLGMITLKPTQLEKGLKFSKSIGFNPKIPTYKPDDDVIVEWRSCTICLLDQLLPLVNEKLGVTGTQYEMSLPQLIEAGSWSSGRLIAKSLRSNGGPPIELYADGTVF